MKRRSNTHIICHKHKNNNNRRTIYRMTINGKNIIYKQYSCKSNRYVHSYVIYTNII